MQDSLARLGLAEGVRWLLLPQGGDRLCTIEAWPDALADAREVPPAAAVGAPLVTVAPPTTSTAAAAMKLSWPGSPRTLKQPMKDARTVDELFGGTTDAADDCGATSSDTALGLWPTASASSKQAGSTTAASTAAPSLLPRPEARRRRNSNQGSISRRFALYLISPSHLCVGAGGAGRELASSEIRGRVLRRRGYAGVLAVRVDAWLALQRPGQRDGVLRDALMQCMADAAAAATRAAAQGTHSTRGSMRGVR